MKAPLNTARLFIEILAAIAVAEVAVTFLLPMIAPGVVGTLGGLIRAAMLAILAGPVILWRVRAAVKTSDRNYTTDMAAIGRRLKLGVVTVLSLGLGLSLAAGWRIHGSIQTEARGRFQTLTKDALEDVQRRVNQAVYGLKGARGVYAASKSVERLEFKAYADSRNLAKEFPGGLGFGFIERVMRTSGVAGVDIASSTGGGEGCGMVVGLSVAAVGVALRWDKAVGSCVGIANGWRVGSAVGSRVGGAVTSAPALVPISSSGDTAGAVGSPAVWGTVHPPSPKAASNSASRQMRFQPISIALIGFFPCAMSLFMPSLYPGLRCVESSLPIAANHKATK